MPKRSPSAELFVVRGAGMPKLERLVRANRSPIDVQPLKDGALVLRLKGEATRALPKGSWRSLQKAVGSEGLVSPVLVDDDGHQHYPTGTVQVRFAEAPSDRALASFAERHGLEVVERNRYQPAQVTFAMRRPRTTYLPDLVEKLSAARGVRRAWAEAEARYER